MAEYIFKIDDKIMNREEGQDFEADLVGELVRCRYCVHNQQSETRGNASCELFYGMTDQNGFCHMGEVRTFGS